MAVVWANEPAAAVVLARYSRTRRQRRPTDLADAGWHPDQCRAAISSMLRFPDSVGRHDRERLLEETFRELGREPTAADFLSAVDRRVRSFLKRKPKRLVVLASLSLSSHTQMPRVRWASQSKSFGSAYPKRFRQAASEISQRAWENGVQVRDATHLMKVWVNVDARSDWDAIRRGTEAVDNVRAIWNLKLNFRKMVPNLGATPGPVNKVRPGPFATLHKPSGDAQASAWWYDPSFKRGLTSDSLRSQEVAEVTAYQREIRRRLRSHKYTDALLWSLRQYSSALDHLNPIDAFRHLWMVLEHLTDGSFSHKLVVQRTRFLFADGEYAAAILDHLRRTRNAAVHMGESGPHLLVSLFQLKCYVEALLLYHIDAGTRFDSLKEAAEVLSAPSDAKRLQGKIRQLRHAEALLSEGLYP